MLPRRGTGLGEVGDMCATCLGRKAGLGKDAGPQVTRQRCATPLRIPARARAERETRLLDHLYRKTEPEELKHF